MKRFRPYRFPTDYPIKVSAREGLKHARVVNVTYKGAKLENVAGLRSGEKIYLLALTQQIPAIVKWVDGECAGLEFRPELSQMQYQMLSRR